MTFTKTPPRWDNSGQEPSLELQESGFTAGYKPPAPYFNYLFHQYTECIKELQNGALEKTSIILSTTSLKDAALAQEESTVKFYCLSGESYTGTDLPNDYYKYSTAAVYKRYSFITIMLMGSPSNSDVAICHYNWTNKAWTDWSFLPSKSYVDVELAKRNLNTYTLLHQIGITIGTETIQSIAQKIPMNSILTYSVSANYKDDTYPDYGEQDRNGVMEVIRGASTNVFFRFTRSANADKDSRMWVGNWGTTTGWSGWKEVAYVTNGTLTSDNADFAEVGEWSDGNPDSEDRLGYFVSVSKTESGITMTKATADSDVRGVTIASPAFATNASRDKYGEDGNLLNQYNYVAFAGFATVIDNGTCTVNGRCMPDGNGCAVPSTNTMGYQVIERVDDTHILILVEPNAGSATNPIYFSDGVPKACTYELNKTVPADAVFTDTIAVKSVEDTSIQLTDAKDANMLLNHAPVNMLNITIESKTINGLTITVNSDKSIKVKGTVTDCINAIFLEIGTFRILAGQTFSFGQTKDANGFSGSVNDDGTCNDDSYMYCSGDDYSVRKKVDGIYTATVNTTANVGLYAQKGTIIDCTYYPRVYYENKQYEYVPPEGYTITACGKNLFPLIPPNQLSDNEGIRCTTVIENDSIKYTCIISNHWIGSNNAIRNLKPNTKYRLKAHLEKTNESMKTYILLGGRDSIFTDILTYDLDIIGTSNSDGALSFMVVVSQNGVNNVGDYVHLTNIMLTEGEESYTYEKSVSSKVFVDNTSKFPITGLDSYNELTNIYNSYGATMEVAYANNSAGKAILDGLCNNSEIIDNNSEIIDNSISDEWNSTKTYYAGDYCIENNELWKCKGMNTGGKPSGSSGSTYWDKVTIASELNSKANTGYKKLLTIPKGSIDYQASTTYTLSVGKFSDYSSILLVDHNNSYSTVPLPIFENGSKVNVGTGDVEVKYSSDIKIVVSISGESAGNYGLTVYGL